MSKQESINVYDRRCEADRFQLSETLHELGMSDDKVEALVNGPGCFSVMMVFEHMIAMNDAMPPVYPLVDGDAVRMAIHALLDSFSSQGIADVPIMYISATTRALVTAISE